MAAVSLAPYAKLAAYKKRMGWGFPWWSSLGSDFNFDYRVSFADAETKAGKVDYNYRLEPWAISGGTRHQRVPEGQWSDLPLVLHLCAWPRHAERRLPLHGSVPKGRDEGDGGAAVWVRRRDEYRD
jgi:predicted dithiol-disulfide oxidoreductase (DUF899 family)